MYPERFGSWKKKPRNRMKVVESEAKIEQLSFQVKPELREQLIALAYLRGQRGAYAGIARELLTREVRRYLAAELDPDERREYENILQSVKANLKVSRMKRQWAEKKAAIAETSATIESETEMLMTDDDEEEGR